MPTYRTLCNRAHKYALIGHAYRRWYRVSREVIRRLAFYHYGKTPETNYRTLCDIVAITSPRVSVKRNLRHAWGEFTGLDRPSDMMRSTRSALEHYYRTGEIRGPKTRRFARVLQGDDSVVVVDTWMARALSIPDNQARNKASQELAERVVYLVQGHLNRGGPVPFRSYWGPCTMAETQAAIWAGIVRSTYKNGKIPMMRTADVGLYPTGPGGRLEPRILTPF